MNDPQFPLDMRQLQREIALALEESDCDTAAKIRVMAWMLRVLIDGFEVPEMRAQIANEIAAGIHALAIAEGMQ